MRQRGYSAKQPHPGADEMCESRGSVAMCRGSVVMCRGSVVMCRGSVAMCRGV